MRHDSEACSRDIASLHEDQDHPISQQPLETRKRVACSFSQPNTDEQQKCSEDIAQHESHTDFQPRNKNQTKEGKNKQKTKTNKLVHSNNKINKNKEQRTKNKEQRTKNKIK
jgi:hypothetical protein